MAWAPEHISSNRPLRALDYLEYDSRNHCERDKEVRLGKEDTQGRVSEPVNIMGNWSARLLGHSRREHQTQLRIPERDESVNAVSVIG